MYIVCRKPYLSRHRCGQCKPCRIYFKKVWQHRLVLESFCHGDNAFVTLTYEKTPDRGSLSVSHYQRWLKRLRKDVGAFRYYLVGEYGEQGMRPHYHAALFGISPLLSHRIQSTWDLGFTFTGDLTVASAAYVAGYVTKKLTSPDSIQNWAYREAHGQLLGDRLPEFARMSRRPGVGATAIPSLGVALTTDAGCDLLIKRGDVPVSIRTSGRTMALGRYLRGKLREELGFPENATDGWLLRATQELCALQEAYEADASNKKSYYQYQAETRKQKILNIEARFNVANKGGLL